MEIEIRNTDEDVKRNFENLINFKDVAHLLEISAETLYKILFINKHLNYKEFTLNRGKVRTIYSPKKNLMIIQRKLAYILSLLYSHHTKSHGYIKEKSIISNANEHVQQRYVLNFDLKDFFDSISFGRIRAMFMTYFKFNDKVSTTLANICCHPNGFLPQGAPTSPIISNIISYRLDKNLDSISRRYNCKYTRYVDDITISTSRIYFPKAIGHGQKGSDQAVVSEKIKSIVHKNGFKVNDKKTRLNSKYENLSVTGITVNETLNVKRSYVRYIRVILHSIEKGIEEDNLDKAQKKFNEQYNFRQRKKGNLPDMYSVIRGRSPMLDKLKGRKIMSIIS
ncbi:reverse transcriptase domain-containing protein [Salicibibacter halophilus]|nr:reverse transcriptase domain-containing protein [Salicibibacter halophilus]